MPFDLANTAREKFSNFLSTGDMNAVTTTGDSSTPNAKAATTAATTTATTETAAPAAVPATEPVPTDRPARGSEGEQAPAAPAPDAPTNADKTEVTAPAPSGESAAVAAEDAAKLAAAQTDDDVSALPLHLQERGRQLVAQKNEAQAKATAAEERAAALEARLAELEAAKTAPEAPPSMQTPLGSVPLPQETLDALAQMGFTGPHAMDDYSIAQAREQYVAALKAQVNSGEKSLQDAEAELSAADMQANLARQQRDLAWERQQIERQKADAARETRVRESAAKTSAALEKYPYADADFLASYVAEGHEPEAAAKFLHDKAATVADAAVGRAVAAERAKGEAALAALKAEYEQRLQQMQQKAAAPSTLGGAAGARNTAPNGGTETPRGGGGGGNGFGLGRRAREMLTGGGGR